MFFFFFLFFFHRKKKGLNTEWEGGRNPVAMLACSQQFDAPLLVRMMKVNLLLFTYYFILILLFLKGFIGLWLFDRRAVVESSTLHCVLLL